MDVIVGVPVGVDVPAQVEAGLGDGSFQSPGGGCGGGETEKAREREREPHEAGNERGPGSVSAACTLPGGANDLAKLAQGAVAPTSEGPGVLSGTVDLAICFMLWGATVLARLSPTTLPSARKGPSSRERGAMNLASNSRVS